MILLYFLLDFNGKGGGAGGGGGGGIVIFYGIFSLVL